jgi:hypothetical protein
MKTDLQALRQSALSSQLSALEAQSRALGSMATEHHGGISIGTNIGPESLVTRARALVSAAQTCAAETDHEAQMAAIDALKLAAAELVADSHKIAERGEGSARRRLEDHIKDAAPVVEPFDVAIVPNEDQRLGVQAEVSCCQAETEQFETFIMQIKALTDLCLELALVAASHQAS